jgi:hypothetical protein
MSDDDTAIERDAHLLAALRHAPDADARPSAALTQAILDAARHAAARPGWRERLLSAWAQPAPWAAFATLALGTVIGVLWMGGDTPPPDATPSLRAPGAAPAASPPAPLADAARSAAQAPAADPPVNPRAALPRAPAKRERAQVESRELPAAAPPLDERAAATTAPRREDLAAAAPLPPQAQKKSSADAAVSGLRMEGTSRLGRLVADHDDPLRGVRSLLSDDPLRLVWQLSASSRDVEHQPAQREWALAFDAATRGRWHRTAATEGAAPALTLRADGRVLGMLSLADDRVLWRDAAGASWSADLPPDLIVDWRKRIAGW